LVAEEWRKLDKKDRDNYMQIAKKGKSPEHNSLVEKRIHKKAIRKLSKMTGVALKKPKKARNSYNMFVQLVKQTLFTNATNRNENRC
jgi:hypothetical protein